MVEQFLRLKLRLLANAFRRSPWQLVGLVLGVLYGLGIAFALLLGLVLLRAVEPEFARAAVVPLGALALLGFLVVPLAAGVEDTMDPRRFALFGIPSNRLVLGLSVAALISIPSLVLLLAGVLQVVTWSRGPLALLVALLAAPLIVVTGVIGARVSTSAGAFLFATRRSREAIGSIAVVSLLLLAGAAVVLGNVDWGTEGVQALTRIADVVGWTPFGAAWSAPADVAVGSVGSGLLKLLIATVTAGLLLLAWRALVVRMLITPQREGPAREYEGLGWFDSLPDTKWGAVAARAFTYWARDPRYRIQFVTLPFVPAFMIVALLIAGVDARDLALLPVPIIALFIGWAIHNDVAYDSTAVWMHVASAVRGASDRFGRVVPLLFFGSLVIVAGSVISAYYYGDWAVLPSILGLGLSVLWAGLGISSVMSASFPYPTTKPGDSPFSHPQSSGNAAPLIQSLSFLANVVLAAPVLWFGGMGLFVDPQWHWAALWTGLGIGVLALSGGVALGGRIFERRAPELVAFALRS